MSLFRYPDSEAVIRHLKEKGTTVLHGVDATKLDQKFGPKCKLDRIIFNFPHSGQQRVHINRNLLRNFFASARTKLKTNGEVHVTLKTLPPYSGWCIEEQAQLEGYTLLAAVPFAPHLYPGKTYHRVNVLSHTVESSMT